jgi:hypothetical protein
MSDIVIPSIGVTSTPASSGLTSTATTADLIEQTKRHLYTGRREERNKLATTVNNSIATIVLTYADPSGTSGGFKAGGKLSCELEDMHIWPNGTHPNVPVERGQFGSTAAPHSAGAILLANAKFTDFEIFRALNEALLALSSPMQGLYRMRQLPDPSWVASQQGYDLTGVTDLLDIYEIRWKSQATVTKNWPHVRDWTLSRDMATAEFASSSALFLYSRGTTGQPIHITYKAPFGQLALSDYPSGVVSTITGFSPYALDILPMWAAVRLSDPREIARNFSERQGDTRRASEVPAGASGAASRALAAQLEMRIRQERSRLSQQYPDVVARYHR